MCLCFSVTLNVCLSFCFQISELLELLLSLLEVRGKNDQIYRLMFEPAMGELLYMLLTQEEYSGTLKEKVLKVCDTYCKNTQILNLLTWPDASTSTCS